MIVERNQNSTLLGPESRWLLTAGADG